MPKYTVSYTVNVQGWREVEAASAAEAEDLVKHAKICEMDLDGAQKEPVAIFEVSPDERLEDFDDMETGAPPIRMLRSV